MTNRFAWGKNTHIPISHDILSDLTKVGKSADTHTYTHTYVYKHTYFFYPPLAVGRGKWDVEESEGSRKEGVITQPVTRPQS